MSFTEAQRRRCEFTHNHGNRIGEAKSLTELLTLAKEQAEAVSMGRTDRWRSACLHSSERILEAVQQSGKRPEAHVVRGIVTEGYVIMAMNWH